MHDDVGNRSIWQIGPILADKIMHNLPCPVVTRCLIHASDISEHLQLRTEAAIILKLLRCLDNLTSWNILLRTLKSTE